MNRHPINLIFVFILLTAMPSVSVALENNSTDGSPVLSLDSSIYCFDPVLEGEKVTHDFIVKNKGDALLQIYSVNASCGCTAASYSKEVPPGESGKITLTLNTKNYGGKSVNKTARVKTNAPKNKSVTLTLSGKIEAYAEIEPSRAVLKGAAGDDIRTEIRIIPNKKSSLRITGVKAGKGKNISLDLKEVKDQDGIQYLLSVINLSKTAAEYTDTIYLTTDSELKPQITIKVSGEIL